MDPPAEAVLIDIIHDLRQPLSTIETSAFILRSLLPQAPPEVRQQLQLIERQVALASRLLVDARTRARPAVQRTAEGDSLEFTKSATAAVT